MNKKLRTILLVLVIAVLGGVTIWRSVEKMQDDADVPNQQMNEEESSKVQGDATADQDGFVLTGQDNTVTVRCEGGSGNGVLLTQNESSYVIVTAGHVAQSLEGKTGQDLLMEIAGVEVCLGKLYISDLYDLAIIEAPISPLQEALKDKQVAGLNDEGFMNLKEGDRLCVCSYLQGEMTDTFVTVNSPWIMVEDFGYHMIWAAATQTKGGMSGSGAFDREGHLAGILCGGNEDEVAILPMNIILGELKNSSIDISFE